MIPQSLADIRSASCIRQPLRGGPRSPSRCDHTSSYLCFKRVEGVP
ncbi:hypothetical protein STVIR_3795 [Streptomyces viridochromogenes Tue57]|uniref:Uncharacterized protein n=1 Tax=Streptomyces viridochromogenes Tue57 TaxID=1160705 RepID=L8PGS7_STRVR|nr:hypothetical protein STVIR_3795 [Streptomyces viridochromogenes Tue57]